MDPWIVFRCFARRNADRLGTSILRFQLRPLIAGCTFGDRSTLFRSDEARQGMNQLDRDHLDQGIKNEQLQSRIMKLENKISEMKRVHNEALMNPKKNYIARHLPPSLSCQSLQDESGLIKRTLLKSDTARGLRRVQRQEK
jgi:hypothetical protein